MKTFCIVCKRKTDSISSTYNISHMKYMRIFCIECRNDKKKRYNILLDKMNRSNKKLPHRFKVSNDVIQGSYTSLTHAYIK